VRALVLKLGATVLTLSSTVVAAVYVTAHLKNPTAPLQPTVIGSTQTANVSVGGVTIGPSVHQGDVPPVTSTYAS
jgi:hypothetical protein